MTGALARYASLWGPGTLRRKVLVVLVALLLVFLLVHALSTFVIGRSLYSTIDRLEEKWGDLSLSTLVLQDVAKGNNRAPVVRAATDLLTLEREEKRVVSNYASFGEQGLSGDEATLLERALADNALAFALLAEAAKRPESNWAIPYREGAQAELPSLLDFLLLSRLNVARTLRHLQEGDTEAAVAAVEQGLAMTESLAREPVLIIQLIRISCERLNLGALREIIARGEPDATMLARLQRSVERIGEIDPMRLGMIGEMKVFFNEFRAIEGGTVRGSDEPLIRRAASLAWLLRPIIRSDIRFYLNKMDAMLDYQDQPHHQRGELPGAEPRFYHVISRFALPDLENAVLRGDLNEARVALARTALALERYRLDRGVYPDDLQLLAPDYLDDLALDPFSGEPPRYDRGDDGFVLHSEGDSVVLPKLKNTDHVLHWEIQG